MIVTGQCIFSSTKTGVKKDGDAWYLVKLHDADSENYVNLFINPRIYEKASKIAKGTAVVLQLEIILGTKRAELVDIDPLP